MNDTPVKLLITLTNLNVSSIASIWTMKMYKAVDQYELFLLKVQFGAPGSHSDVLVHIRCAGPDILNPRSQVYVADERRVLLPCRPAVTFIIPFSTGKRFPQSIGTRQSMCSCNIIIWWRKTLRIFRLNRNQVKVDTSHWINVC